MKIYIVDDDASIRESLVQVLRDEEYEVDSFAAGEAMLAAIEKDNPALVLLDVWMGKEDGLEILGRLRERYPTLPVLMISGHGTIEQAVAATKKGAFDFLEKPLSIDLLLEKISAILHLPDRTSSDTEDEVKLEFDDIVGTSQKIQHVKRDIARAAVTNARVFIYGENGTGKELIARAIYRNSKRAQMPFVDINCAAIPEELIESELFGYEKGAFTGANDRKIGKFEQANHATLFLDEICDMSLATQARVLRALQEQRFQRVGGRESIDVDVRIISATNIRPEEAIEEGRFREDLYYRLNVIPITVPPLRERPEDIPLLVLHFMRLSAKENDLPERSFSSTAMEMLKQHVWPGNVRELRNVVERLCIMSADEIIDEKTVAHYLKDARSAGNMESVQVIGDLRKAREEFERNYIIQALKQHDKNISRVARLIGLERTNLHRKMKALRIDPEKI